MHLGTDMFPSEQTFSTRTRLVWSAAKWFGLTAGSGEKKRVNFICHWLKRAFVTVQTFEDASRHVPGQVVSYIMEKLRI